MSNPENQYFDDGSKLCLLSFFVLGNYFAIFGFKHSSKALNAKLVGDDIEAQRQRRKARAWALWGLLPSTLINILLIYWVVIFSLEKLKPVIDNLYTR